MSIIDYIGVGFACYVFIPALVAIIEMNIDALQYSDDRYDDIQKKLKFVIMSVLFIWILVTGLLFKLSYTYYGITIGIWLLVAIFVIPKVKLPELD